MINIFCENCEGKGYLKDRQMLEGLDACPTCSGDGYISMFPNQVVETASAMKPLDSFWDLINPEYYNMDEDN